MLNSNQVCSKVFKIQDLQKLTLDRLKKFKKACERQQAAFIKTCNHCSPSCYVESIKKDPELFSEAAHVAYGYWSTNLKNIRDIIESKS